MAKSAINLLQEISIKQGYIPIYNFTEKRNDGLDIEFLCNVSCKELTASGTGISKKNAKHNAAKNMLLLFDKNNKIPSELDTSIDAINTSSSSVTNIIQSPAKVFETSSYIESVVNQNYIGMLQEFCQQQKQISIRDIVYKLINEEGQSHQKTFTIEVSVGSLRERGIGKCKKIAKQEAAKKILLRLSSNTAFNPNTADSNTDNLITVDQNIANPNTTSSNITPLNINRVNLSNNEILKNNIRKLGIEILESETNNETLVVKELSKKVKSLYLEYTGKNYTDEKTDQEIKNFHTLFQKNYSNKIPYNVKEKMRIIRDKYTDQTDLLQIRWDIENAMEVKIQTVTIGSTTKNHIVCLRLLSKPVVTQIGMGETKFIAESRAMYNLIASILIFLNI